MVRLTSFQGLFQINLNLLLPLCFSAAVKGIHPRVKCKWNQTVGGIQYRVHPAPCAHHHVLQCTANMTPRKAPYIRINAKNGKVKATSCMLTTNTN